jgi:CRP-like cAMP-binding protein
MPLLDGFGVLHMLNKKTPSRNIPFIFLTSKTERTDIRKGMNMGADDYITKPFNPTELLNSIESRLRKAVVANDTTTNGITRVEPLLSVLNETDSVEALKAGRNINKYKKKQYIYQESNYPSCLFYVIKGKVKTYKRNDNGKELITGLYNEGDFLGYAALLDNVAYKENAEALEDAELAVIPRKDFEALTNINTQVMQRFIRLLATSITEKELQLLGVAYNSLRKKVAEALLIVNKKYNPLNSDKFGIDISRENLAAVAGVAKESLIRTLGDLRDEKLIDIRGGCIFLFDTKKLSGLIN